MLTPVDPEAARRARELLEQAKGHFEQGDFRAATPLLEEAIQLLAAEPAVCGDALLLLFDVRMQATDHAGAQRIAQQPGQSSALQRRPGLSQDRVDRETLLKDDCTEWFYDSATRKLVGFGVSLSSGGDCTETSACEAMPAMTS